MFVFLKFYFEFNGLGSCSCIDSLSAATTNASRRVIGGTQHFSRLYLSYETICWEMSCYTAGVTVSLALCALSSSCRVQKKDSMISMQHKQAARLPIQEILAACRPPMAMDSQLTYFLLLSPLDSLLLINVSCQDHCATCNDKHENVMCCLDASF